MGKIVYKNPFFMPLLVWAGVLVDITRKMGAFAYFFVVSHVNFSSRSSREGGFKKPDFTSFNAAFGGSLEESSILGVTPKLFLGIVGVFVC